MRACAGGNLWLVKKQNVLVFLPVCKAHVAIATSHKGRGEAYFRLDFFVYFLYQDKK